MLQWKIKPAYCVNTITVLWVPPTRQIPKWIESSYLWKHVQTLNRRISFLIHNGTFLWFNFNALSYIDPRYKLKFSNYYSLSVLLVWVLVGGIRKGEGRVFWAVILPLILVTPGHCNSRCGTFSNFVRLPVFRMGDDIIELYQRKR